MVNYQLGKIYTVRSLTSPEIYVGSTIAPLCKRMAVHRSNWKKGLILGRNKEIVKDINKWYIELYENFPCDKVEELTAREGVIIREIGTLNKNIAGRTAKDYYIDNTDTIKTKIKQYKIKNADNIKEYKKDYYLENIDRIKEHKKQKYLENIDKIKEQRLKKNLENVDNIKEYKQKYYLENIDKIKEQKKQKYLERKLAKVQ